MGIFGWSLPPGCGTLPGEETGACDITKYIEELGYATPPDCNGVFWDEDGALWENWSYVVPADPECGIPSFKECDAFKVGEHDWNYEHHDEDNFRASARAYINLKGATA